MHHSQTTELKKNSTRNLLLGILFDAIGTLSFAIPLLGEFSDVVWAPISGLLMVWLYPGAKGRVAGIVSAVEEILPFTDILPTFTLMWLYTYVLNRRGGK